MGGDGLEIGRRILSLWLGAGINQVLLIPPAYLGPFLSIFLSISTVRAFSRLWGSPRSGVGCRCWELWLLDTRGSERQGGGLTQVLWVPYPSLKGSLSPQLLSGIRTPGLIWGQRTVVGEAKGDRSSMVGKQESL